MNNPANIYNSSNQPSAANNSQAMNSNLQQLSSTQADYINQFVGTTPQSSYPQAPNMTTQPQQQMNPVAQQPQVNLSMNQPVAQAQPQMAPVQSYGGQNSPNLYTDQLQNNPNPISSEPISSPQLSNDYLNQEPVDNSLLNTPQIPPYEEFSVPTLNDSLQNQPSSPIEPQINSTEQSFNSTNVPTSQLNQSYGNPATQTNVMQQQYNPAIPQDYTAPAQQVSPSTLNTLPQNPQSPVNVEPQLMGAQQVNVNQDYAERYSNSQWLPTPLSPANQMQAMPQMNQQQYNPVYQNPTTNLTVDNDFSDGASLGDDSSLSTGFLPAFDDNSDDSMLPATNDDDDDVFGNLDEPDDVIPFGFSDYDPNEQVTGSLDSLSGFESQSLEEEANRIDVDFSESMPTNSQNVGVLTQEPQRASVAQMPQTMVPNQTVSAVSYAAPAPTSQNQMEPQVQQVAMPVDSELSPTARLNQLLEEEEKAEKVIMQKQKQSVMKVAKSPKMVEPKSNIFKQTNDDVAFQGDIRNELSAKKPASRYFMIISLIIIISVIGFLLVLLGLTLL
ncbi:MAG TPA: hypothetical protein PK863_03810 [Candidatus Dojkabacteria bacterium]|nr:hypothetical protein [Candidatus Dojkabacteria bacterium]